ncbi:MAG: sn-glycerol-3-phosphate ABC transporter ATP-binding protein UgpC [Planctomycetes bacterium]|nr:sn-glycerol-3-phosphate ABC transporter ATP-binding protein UgpC [Planctomycetota bacterium]
MADVELKNVEKVYPGGVKAVCGASLRIADREFVVLVGPSGCGKSTTLRMIAGLEEISGGMISIGGSIVNDVAPKDRDIAMVFQNYALYPHMTCFENMAFGLKLRNFPKDEIRRRVEDAAQILGIHDLLQRKPKALSGGQRQRVAVGRAIVRKPAVFLFDEPLSNLDAKLRVEMRVELHKLHQRLATTMIYVTHDQIEAMTLGDRIVIMDKGEIQQVASPLSLYDEPYNQFVASFIGTPAMNFLDGSLQNSGDGIVFRDAGSIQVPLPKELGDKLSNHLGKPVLLGIRPEHIHDPASGASLKLGAKVQAKVEVVESLGDLKVVYFVEGPHRFVGKVDAHVPVATGQTMDLVFDANKVHVFEKNTGRNLTCRVPQYEAANEASLPQPAVAAAK